MTDSLAIINEVKASINVEKVAEFFYRVCRAIDNMGRPSDMPNWADADLVIREFINSVNVIINNPSITVEELHNLEVEYLKSKGWTRGDGGLKNKTHPDICPYSELDEDTKRLGMICREIVISHMLLH